MPIASYRGNKIASQISPSASGRSNGHLICSSLTAELLCVRFSSGADSLVQEQLSSSVERCLRRQCFPAWFSSYSLPSHSGGLHRATAVKNPSLAPPLLIAVIFYAWLDACLVLLLGSWRRCSSSSNSVATWEVPLLEGVDDSSGWLIEPVRVPTMSVLQAWNLLRNPLWNGLIRRTLNEMVIALSSTGHYW